MTAAYKKTQDVAPLIGILAGKRKNKAFSGDRKYFAAICKELQQRGGRAFIFTFDHIREKTIEGYTFYQHKWQKYDFPYPAVVYNRLPTTKQEKSNRAQLFFKQLKERNIPYFNPVFFNKWKTYTLLVKNKMLQPFLPKTIRATNRANMRQFLQNQRFIYAKPVSGKTGNGIFVLTFANDGRVLMQSHKQMKVLSETECHTFLSRLASKKNPYLLQSGIALQQHDGKRYDFRILMQKPKKSWKMTAIGVRQAADKGITTHVPKGGSILSLNDIDPPVNRQLIRSLGTTIAETLESTYSEMKECSIDIGRDWKGHYWIFEVNAKPMSFDEKAIEAKRVKILVDTFINQTTPLSH